MHAFLHLSWSEVDKKKIYICVVYPLPFFCISLGKILLNPWIAIIPVFKCSMRNCNAF